MGAAGAPGAAGPEPPNPEGESEGNAGGPAGVPAEGRPGGQPGGSETAAFEPQLLAALAALNDGNLAVRMPAGWTPVQDEIAHTFNAHLEQLATFHGEVGRVLRVIGVEGRLGVQAETPRMSGAWRALVGDVNTMSAALTNQLRDAKLSVVAYAEGNLDRPMTAEAAGEMLEMKTAINDLAVRLQELKGAVENFVARQKAMGL